MPISSNDETGDVFVKETMILNVTAASYCNLS